MNADKSLSAVLNNLLDDTNNGEGTYADSSDVDNLTRGQKINRLSAVHRGEQEAGVRVLDL